MYYIVVRVRMCSRVYKCTVGVKKYAPFPFSLRSVPFRFTGNERAEKMVCRFARFARSVLPVLPVLPSNPSACARSNESCLSGDPAYRRVCTRGRQYPPSLAPSLARPELNGRKRTERLKNGENGKKNGTERNGMEWTKKRNGTETERFF